TTYNSTLVALDPTSGSEKWTTTVGAEDNALGVIRSSPAIGADSSTPLIPREINSGLLKWVPNLAARPQSMPAALSTLAQPMESSIV
ncbi:hypothetical protein N9V84_09065, partial [Verrucomicrobiales bacterium]|nr:hypothetical protein [Verrucomicrobiales bacterium]